MECLECRKKLLPLRKETNYLGNRYVPKEWEGRKLHKKCFKEREQRQAILGKLFTSPEGIFPQGNNNIL
jgi:hypothetical protein